MRFLLFLLFLLPAAASAAPKVIHVFVALCDNVNQGIVPVPEKLGNGEDPANNLYWGAAYGVKTWFKKSADWTLLVTVPNPTPEILERCIFNHKTKDAYLVADAWKGKEIKQCTRDFLRAAAGFDRQVLKLTNGSCIDIGGLSNLVTYVGHDGLMDFSIDEEIKATEKHDRQVIILACISKSYFAPYVQKTGAYPLLWTTQLMTPEAYTLEYALTAWLSGKDAAGVHLAGATAYDKYQRCGINGAKKLLTTGY